MSTNLEALIEEGLDYDQIYIEISDKENQTFATVVN